MFFVAGLLLAGFVSHANASTTTPLLSEDEYRVGQGDVEVSFLMNPQFISGIVSDERFTLNLGANYFLDDIWAPGLEMDIDVGAGNSFKLIPNVKAYLPLDSRWMPYVQLGFGYTHAFTSDFATVVLGPGINYLISNTVAIGAQLRYDLGLGNQTTHLIQVPVQFALYFKY